jgi:hypothetical protein
MNIGPDVHAADPVRQAPSDARHIRLEPDVEHAQELDRADLEPVKQGVGRHQDPNRYGQDHVDAQTPGECGARPELPGAERSDLAD